MRRGFLLSFDNICHIGEVVILSIGCWLTFGFQVRYMKTLPSALGTISSVPALSTSVPPCAKRRTHTLSAVFPRGFHDESKS